MDSMDLKVRQTAAIERMLNLTGSVSSSEQWSEQWKVLVYDRAGRDIISPLLNVAQLRRNGVTLHMLLDSEREPIPDVPAVYFCLPTAENISRIAKDCSNNLYAAVHLNFISKLERRLMEDLARLVIDTGSVNTIAKVFDQHVDFVALEPRLFTLNRKNSYASYNGADQSEEAINGAMRSFTHGIFSVVATLGALPIIRAPPNGPSEMVARQLNDLVSQAWSGGAGGPFFETGSTVSARPLVIILDRALDFATVLQHTCTYQALVDDVLEYKMNRVTVPEDSGGGAGKTYDLEVEQDLFWKKNAPQPFPEAIDDNSSELARIKELEKEIKEKTAAGSADGVAGAAEAVAVSTENSGTQELLATVDSLPKLLERKKKLESHTNILQAAMRVIAARELPVFYEAETSNRSDQESLLALMKSSKGSLTDKLRLFAVLSLRAADTATPLLAQLEDELKATCASDAASQGELTAGLAAIKHMRQMQSFQQQHTPVQAEAPAAPSASGGISSWMQSKTAGILGHVQNFLSRSDENYVTRVIDNLCEFKPGTEDESFLSLDPRRKEQQAKESSGSERAPFREVLVFMVGGGCYAEYQHINAYGKKHPERQITYGCTELVNGEGLLKQVASVGS